MTRLQRWYGALAVLITLAPSLASWSFSDDCGPLLLELPPPTILIVNHLNDLRYSFQYSSPYAQYAEPRWSNYSDVAFGDPLLSSISDAQDDEHEELQRMYHQMNAHADHEDDRPARNQLEDAEHLTAGNGRLSDVPQMVDVGTWSYQSNGEQVQQMDSAVQTLPVDSSTTDYHYNNIVRADNRLIESQRSDANGNLTVASALASSLAYTDDHEHSNLIDYSIDYQGDYNNNNNNDADNVKENDGDNRNVARYMEGSLKPEDDGIIGNGGSAMDECIGATAAVQQPSQINLTDYILSDFISDNDLHLVGISCNENGESAMMPLSNAHLSSLFESVDYKSVVSSNKIKKGCADDKMDTSSDSAVSSMSSERVGSVSDVEWVDTGSDNSQNYDDQAFGGTNTLKKYRFYGKKPEESGNNRPIAGTITNLDAEPRKTPSVVTVSNYPSTSVGVAEASSMAAAATTQSADRGMFEYQFPNANYLLDGSEIAFNYAYDLFSNSTGIYGNNSLDSAGSMFASVTSNPELDDQNHQASTSQVVALQNHTYYNPMPLTSVDMNELSGRVPSCSRSYAEKMRPYERRQSTRVSISSDSKSMTSESMSEEERSSRDEKKAKELNLPLNVNEIINMPIDEFNNRLVRHEFTDAQLTLIRDIRRRGKNKVAAQNCRKRKMDQIVGLQSEVDHLYSHKNSLLSYSDQLYALREIAQTKYQRLFAFLQDNGIAANVLESVTSSGAATNSSAEHFTYTNEHFANGNDDNVMQLLNTTIIDSGYGQLNASSSSSSSISISSSSSSSTSSSSSSSSSATTGAGTSSNNGPTPLNQNNAFNAVTNLA